jgi:hypothetical protein
MRFLYLSYPPNSSPVIVFGDVTVSQVTILKLVRNLILPDE